MIALFNRALMLNNTGDYRGAIRDINAVIKEFPNFWTGYQFRAEVRRKMGDTKGAELDEFKVLKAQMDQRYGGKKPQPVSSRPFSSMIMVVNTGRSQFSLAASTAAFNSSVSLMVSISTKSAPGAPARMVRANRS